MSEIPNAGDRAGLRWWVEHNIPPGKPEYEGLLAVLDAYERLFKAAKAWHEDTGHGQPNAVRCDDICEAAGLTVPEWEAPA